MIGKRGSLDSVEDTYQFAFKGAIYINTDYIESVIVNDYPYVNKDGHSINRVFVTNNIRDSSDSSRIYNIYVLSNYTTEYKHNDNSYGKDSYASLNIKVKRQYISTPSYHMNDNINNDVDTDSINIGLFIDYEPKKIIDINITNPLFGKGVK